MKVSSRQQKKKKKESRKEKNYILDFNVLSTAQGHVPQVEERKDRKKERIEEK